MILNENYILSNGVEVPKLGLGTWEISNDKVAQAVKEAVAIGYRHIDTAQGYNNESGVGEGIRICGMKREDIFVTTKLDAEIKNYEDTVKAIDGSLRQLGLDYIDLMIIHAPKPWSQYDKEDRHFEGNLEAWRALEEAYKAGKLRAIGVSNFQIVDLKNIMENGSVKPMVNQILTHISNTPFELIDFCQQNDILIEAYSPIAHGELLKNEKLQKIAKKYNTSIPQLAIRYCLELGLLPLPKSSNPKNIESNVKVDFTISTEDMDTLKKIEPIENYGEFSHFPVFWK